MIVAVCLNPALDLTYAVDELRPGRTHRVRDVRERAGGKGVNVARVAHALDVPVTLVALGAVDELRTELAEDGVTARLVATQHPVRRTVAVVDTSTTTMFTEPGSTVTPVEWAALVDAVRSVCTAGSVVVLSGSVRPGCPADAYAALTRLAHEAGARVIVDADGPALLEALPAAPDIVKPNADEVAGLLGRPAAGADDAHLAARDLRRRGAAAAVVSLGADGLVAATGAASYRAKVPAVTGNPTGAGDALVAALAAGLLRDDPWPALLADAVAVAACAVAAPVAGVISPELAATLRPAVVVEES